jgi:hypothetical protein
MNETTKTSQSRFEQAKRKFVHRFTMEHVPVWAHKRANNGKFYAPQFRTDWEWFINTLFSPLRRYCETNGQTWPLGEWLEKPFEK